MMDIVAPLCEKPFRTSRTGKPVSLGDLSPRYNLQVLHAVVDSRSLTCTLEVGLAPGASAPTLAGWCRNKGITPLGQHIAIDPFQTSVWDDCGAVALEEAGLDRYITIERDYSSLALGRLIANKPDFGVICIDGLHFCEDVFVDTYFWARLLTQDGTVPLGDASDPHVH